MKKGANEMETPDISQILMSSLARIEAKVDEQASNFSRINERAILPSLACDVPAIFDSFKNNR